MGTLQNLPLTSALQMKRFQLCLITPTAMAQIPGIRQVPLLGMIRSLWVNTTLMPPTGIQHSGRHSCTTTTGVKQLLLHIPHPSSHSTSSNASQVTIPTLMKQPPPGPCSPAPPHQVVRHRCSTHRQTSNKAPLQQPLYQPLQHPQQWPLGVMIRQTLMGLWHTPAGLPQSLTVCNCMWRYIAWLGGSL